MNIIICIVIHLCIYLLHQQQITMQVIDKTITDQELNELIYICNREMIEVCSEEVFFHLPNDIIIQATYGKTLTGSYSNDPRDEGENYQPWCCAPQIWYEEGSVQAHLTIDQQIHLEKKLNELL